MGERRPAVLRSMSVIRLTGFEKGATQKIFIMQACLEKVDRQGGQTDGFRVAGGEVEHVERAQKRAFDKRYVRRRERRFRDGLGAGVYRFHPSDRRSLLY